MTAWEPDGWRRYRLTLPDGSVARCRLGGLLTQARFDHAGTSYRLAWWRVRRGGEHVLTVRLPGWRDTFRDLRATVAALWRAARQDRPNDPLPATAAGTVVDVRTGAVYELSHLDGCVRATSGGKEVVAVRADPPHAVRTAGPPTDTAVALLFVTTYLAVTDNTWRGGYAAALSAASAAS